MVLHIYVGFQGKTIIDAVQDVKQFYFALFYIFFPGILYIAVGVKIVF